VAGGLVGTLKAVNGTPTDAGTAKSLAARQQTRLARVAFACLCVAPEAVRLP